MSGTTCQRPRTQKTRGAQLSLCGGRTARCAWQTDGLELKHVHRFQSSRHKATERDAGRALSGCSPGWKRWSSDWSRWSTANWTLHVAINRGGTLSRTCPRTARAQAWPRVVRTNAKLPPKPPGHPNPSAHRRGKCFFRHLAEEICRNIFVHNHQFPSTECDAALETDFGAGKLWICVKPRAASNHGNQANLIVGSQNAKGLAASSARPNAWKEGIAVNVIETCSQSPSGDRL